MYLLVQIESRRVKKTENENLLSLPVFDDLNIVTRWYGFTWLPRGYNALKVGMIRLRIKETVSFVVFLVGGERVR